MSESTTLPNRSTLPNGNSNRLTKTRALKVRSSWDVRLGGQIGERRRSQQWGWGGLGKWESSCDQVQTAQTDSGTLAAVLQVAEMFPLLSSLFISSNLLIYKKSIYGRSLGFRWEYGHTGINTDKVPEFTGHLLDSHGWVPTPRGEKVILKRQKRWALQEPFQCIYPCPCPTSSLPSLSSTIILPVHPLSPLYLFLLVLNPHARRPYHGTSVWLYFEFCNSVGFDS